MVAFAKAKWHLDKTWTHCPWALARLMLHLPRSAALLSLEQLPAACVNKSTEAQFAHPHSACHVSKAHQPAVY
eukprot:scaffold164409_cov17-Tisochrysis_lutea.AAC.1